MKQFPVHKGFNANNKASNQIASLILLALLMWVSAHSWAKDSEATRQVQKILDKRKLHYKIDSSGDFQITFKTDEKRTQLVFIRALPFSLGSIQMREVLSAAYRSDSTHFSAQVANKILETNATLRLGAFAKQGSLAVLVVKIPANASANELIDALEATATAADALEKNLSDKDIY